MKQFFTFFVLVFTIFGTNAQTSSEICQKGSFYNEYACYAESKSIFGLTGDVQTGTFSISCTIPETNCVNGKKDTTRSEGIVKCVMLADCAGDTNTLIGEKRARLQQVQTQIQKNNGLMEAYNESKSEIQSILFSLAGKTDATSRSQIQKNQNILNEMDKATQALEKENQDLQSEENRLMAELGDGTYAPEANSYTPNVPVYEQWKEYMDEWLDGPGLTKGVDIAQRGLDENISRTRNLPDLIVGWLNWAFNIVALLAVVAIIYAGFLFIFYYGDDNRKSQAQSIILYVVIGIVLVFAAFAIVNTIISGVS